MREDEIKVVAELLAKIGGNWYPERSGAASRPVGNRHREVARLIIGAVERSRATHPSDTPGGSSAEDLLEGAETRATGDVQFHVGDTVVYRPPGDKRTIACRIEKMEHDRSYLVPANREVGWVSTHTLVQLKQSRENGPRPRLPSASSSTDGASAQPDASAAEVLALASYSQLRIGEAASGARYYFNSFGDWIAFRRFPNDRYLFNTKGNWIGWLPWNDNEVVDINGQYLGTLVDGDRLLRRNSSDPNRREAGFVVDPGSGGYPGTPGHAAHFPLPFGFKDIDPAQIPTGRRSWLRNGTQYGTSSENQSTFHIWMSKIGLGRVAGWIERRLRPT